MVRNSNCSPFGFCALGGTAIALRLGHRTSVDFDLFTDSPLNHKAIFTELPFVSQSTVIQDHPNALSILVNRAALSQNSVKISFFVTIYFGRVGDPELPEGGTLPVASLIDLMASKLKVILQRAEAKDYQDIVVMLNHGIPLSKGLAAAQTIFGSIFQPSESLKAMTYFMDGDLETLTREEKQTLIHQAGAVNELSNIKLLSKKLI